MSMQYSWVEVYCMRLALSSVVWGLKRCGPAGAPEYVALTSATGRAVLAPTPTCTSSVGRNLSRFCEPRVIDGRLCLLLCCAMGNGVQKSARCWYQLDAGASRGEHCSPGRFHRLAVVACCALSTMCTGIAIGLELIMPVSLLVSKSWGLSSVSSGLLLLQLINTSCTE